MDVGSGVWVWTIVTVDPVTVGNGVGLGMEVATAVVGDGKTGKGVNVKSVTPPGIEVAMMGVMLGVAKAMLTVKPQPLMNSMMAMSRLEKNIWERIIFLKARIIERAASWVGDWPAALAHDSLW